MVEVDDECSGDQVEVDDECSGDHAEDDELGATFFSAAADDDECHSDDDEADDDECQAEDDDEGAVQAAEDEDSFFSVVVGAACDDDDHDDDEGVAAAWYEVQVGALAEVAEAGVSTTEVAGESLRAFSAAAASVLLAKCQSTVSAQAGRKVQTRQQQDMGRRGDQGGGGEDALRPLSPSSARQAATERVTVSLRVEASATRAVTVLLLSPLTTTNEPQ